VILFSAPLYIGSRSRSELRSRQTRRTLTNSDELLALRLQAGDSEALDELIGRYYVAIRRYLYRLAAGNAALSEELTQETMFHLIQGIGGYDAGRPFRPWLYTIATNLFRNHMKRAEHRFRQDGDEAAYDVPDEGALTREAMEDRWQAVEMCNRLLAELHRLPEIQRQIIVMRYHEELKLSDIATILNVPLGTVKSRLRLGLERLRETLEVEEE
jgi:RNA polymerase sigma factor (sigma-70 family)